MLHACCALCSQPAAAGVNLGPLLGPIRDAKNPSADELYVHRLCALWSSEVRRGGKQLWLGRANGSGCLSSTGAPPPTAIAFLRSTFSRRPSESPNCPASPPSPSHNVTPMCRCLRRTRARCATCWPPSSAGASSSAATAGGEAPLWAAACPTAAAGGCRGRWVPGEVATRPAEEAVPRCTAVQLKSGAERAAPRRSP